MSRKEIVFEAVSALVYGFALGFISGFSSIWVVFYC